MGMSLSYDMDLLARQVLLDKSFFLPRPCLRHMQYALLAKRPFGRVDPRQVSLGVLEQLG